MRRCWIDANSAMRERRQLFSRNTAKNTAYLGLYCSTCKTAPLYSIVFYKVYIFVWINWLLHYCFWCTFTKVRFLVLLFPQLLFLKLNPNKFTLIFFFSGGPEARLSGGPDAEVQGEFPHPQHHHGHDPLPANHTQLLHGQKEGPQPHQRWGPGWVQLKDESRCFRSRAKKMQRETH